MSCVNKKSNLAIGLKAPPPGGAKNKPRIWGKGVRRS